jgi:hypothetical protein
MAKRKSRGGKKAGARTAASRGRSAASQRRPKFRITRIARSVGAAAGPAALAGAGAAAALAVDPGVPVATIATGGGPVVVAISFGHAQHGQYTIQLFDPAGTTELLRQPGLNTDATPDQFTLSGTPAQLNQHLLQWSGAVSAFTPAPGQQFSVTFDVTQNGAGVPGGHVSRTGPLNITQAFVGVLRLVTP